MCELLSNIDWHGSLTPPTTHNYKAWEFLTDRFNDILICVYPIGEAT